MREDIVIEVVALRPDHPSPLPEYQSAGAAGLDLFASLESDLSIAPGAGALVGTGYAIAIPEGYEGQIRPRSGLALKHQIGILNSPGTIDSDYRGEIRVILFNFGQQPYVIHDGDRIAQLVVTAIPRITLRLVDRLDDTERGGGGYGHTGR